jgi:hypothetical protein
MLPMSLNLTSMRALRAIVVAALLLALVCAMLGSIGLNGPHWGWPDSVVAPGTTPEVPKGSTPIFGTTVPR